METIRAFLHDNCRLALLLLALALAARALVPAGYMVGSGVAGGGKILTISVCADSQGGSYTKQIVVPHSGKSDTAGEHDRANGACAWSALGLASTGGIDAALAVLALLFILALGFTASASPRLVRVLHLRPPLRGPPAFA